MSKLERQVRLENALQDSVDYGNQLTIYSDFKSWLLQNAWYKNYDSFFICGTQKTYGYTTIINFTNFNFGTTELVYYYKDGRFLLEDVPLDESTLYGSITGLISSTCLPLFKNSNYDYNDTVRAMFLVSDNKYTDLQYSNEPSEIITSILYCCIPLLLFLIGFKVLKKGLFR